MTDYWCDLSFLCRENGTESESVDGLVEEGNPFVGEVAPGGSTPTTMRRRGVDTLEILHDDVPRRISGRREVGVRQELKATGSLAPEDHTFHVLVQRQDMTGAERSWASHYEINDVVRYTRGSKAIGIEAAAYASVVAIDPAANLLTVEKANQERATYDPRRLTGVSVYREMERELSLGDRIQFTAPDKSLGVANRGRATIQAIHSDGRLIARLDSNRHLDFNASEHRHFDHGYAVTSHSSQGLTAERVLTLCQS